MARRIGIMGRVFENLKNSLFSAKQKDKFVGSDQYGNKYFEKEEDGSHNLRAGRYIEKEFDPDFTMPEIPVEWEAWLRGRRNNPPTPEVFEDLFFFSSLSRYIPVTTIILLEDEIERNYVRMMQTKKRADELERKYLAEKESANVSNTSQLPQTLTEDIKPNQATNSFPKYEGFESAPGENLNKFDKNK